MSTRTIDCFFWDPKLGLQDQIEFEHEKIGEGIELRKPKLTDKALGKILSRIKENREYLTTIDTPYILDVIDQVTDLWMDPNYEGRKIAKEVLPLTSGFSWEMIESLAFNWMIPNWKKENLPLFSVLDPEEFRDFNDLEDGLVKAYGKREVNYSNHQPEVIGHSCAGNIPGIPIMEIVPDKFLDAATWVKVPSEEPVFGALYTRSIEEVDPKLAHTIAILPFKGGNERIEEFLISNSDVVRATGGEKARRGLTGLAKEHGVPMAGHWHKLSFITISKEYLNERAGEIAELASLDVSAWDQGGCFSPQEIFVEKGGKVKPVEFAKLLANEMEKTYQGLPKGSNPKKKKVLDAYHRYSKKEMVDEDVKMFPSKEHKWLVVYDGSNQTFEPPPLSRVIRVKPVRDIMNIMEIVKPIKRFLQTVGVAIPTERLIPFSDALGELGATNIRVVGNMTLQKAWEPWDGRFLLQELFEQDGIRWTSISTRDIDEEISKSLERQRAIIR